MLIFVTITICLINPCHQNVEQLVEIRERRLCGNFVSVLLMLWILPLSGSVLEGFSNSDINEVQLPQAIEPLLMSNRIPPITVSFILEILESRG